MRDPANRNYQTPDAATGDQQTTLRPMPILIELPFNVLEVIGRAVFFAAWHVLYFVAYAFRAFTGFLVLAGIVMLPVSLRVFVKPDATPMPWSFFLFSAIGMFAFAVGYNLFPGWFAPPGAVDPFERYRESPAGGNRRSL